jgi:transposase
MPRYKPIHQGLKLLPVDFDKQVLPGSFEHALCQLVDHELDLSAFHARYKNDIEGAPAYDPAVLLKLILLAYSRGIVSSRKIEAACRENVVFIAVSGDSQPNFTTLAAFMSELGDLAAQLFAQVLVVCDRQGLIGREMFAIDGVKLPSNASKAKSGTRADYRRQLEKMEKAATKILAQHRQADAVLPEPDAQRQARKLEKLQKEAQQLRDWLDAHPRDRKGSKGSVRLSNLTDNDSAKMATGKGVIQGYTGVATVDAKHQIVVEAQAHGTGSEQELLLPVIEATRDQRTPDTVITADAGYHSKANLQALQETGIDAYLPDTGYRKRDARYQGQEVHQAKPDPLYDKGPHAKQAKRYTPRDFTLAPDRQSCVCPAGHILYRNGENCHHGGHVGIKFQGAKRDCLPCGERHRCLRHPDKTASRQVTFFQGKADPEHDPVEVMKRRIDSDRGRAMIAWRFATVEPVFGNTRGNKRLDRFTLRGQPKVDGQWKLYCLVHNIEKLAHLGYAG